MTFATSARGDAAASTPSLRLLDDVTLGQQIASALRARDPEEGRRLLGKYRIDLRAESDDIVDRFDATRLLDGRWVTVEMATAAVCADADARERFVASARAEQPLRHRCVLALLDTGVTPDGRPFVVREAVDTEPLAQLLARGDALSWKRIRSIAMQLVAAVTAARACGLEPREISLVACRRARHSRAVDEVKLVGLAPAAEVGCDELDDVMAIAVLVQQLATASRELGVAMPPELDEVLARAHAEDETAFVDLAQLSRAFSAIGQGATEWSRIPSTATAGSIDTAYTIVRPVDERQDAVVEVSCASADDVEDR
ncbi:MAG: hypothetical protein IAG13_13320, partial [Deltaproteobacteria bacterium]|nr:hypothetical protein [Nannocystaceae bacterium]